MKIISEAQEEDHMVIAVSYLLGDIGVYAEPFERSEVIAPVFWDASDYLLDYCDAEKIPYIKRQEILLELEEDIRSAMVLAGFEAIQNGFRKYIKNN